MQKTVLILKGSPRESGNSTTLADRLAEGARDARADVECFSVHPMNISPCNACETCRENGGSCVIDDDMQILYPKIRDADALVIATPIYWYTINAQTKTWIDRCYALVMSPEDDFRNGKEFSILMTYASDIFVSGVLNAMQTFKSMVTQGKIVGVVHGQANRPGEILDRPEVLRQAYDLGKQLGMNK